jgi:glyoxylase-like metal-dependent hydrolase (beta-lactamase superfamily II)
METVADNVYRLGTRGHNFYLLRDGDEVTMVDAGCSKEWSQLTEALDALGLSIDAVSGILATHSHADHFGLAKRAADTGIPVSVHADEEPRALGTYTGRYAASASELPRFSIRTLRNFLPMIRAGVMSLDHLDEVDSFSDGDELDLPGSPTALHTPGHTEGHAMFWCSDLGILFTGDGLITMNLTGGDAGPQMIGDVFSHDPAQALESLNRIEDIEADQLLPGHGSPWSGSPAEAVRLAREGPSASA